MRCQDRSSGGAAPCGCGVSRGRRRPIGCRRFAAVIYFLTTIPGAHAQGYEYAAASRLATPGLSVEVIGSAPTSTNPILLCAFASSRLCVLLGGWPDRSDGSIAIPIAISSASICVICGFSAGGRAPGHGDGGNQACGVGSGCMLSMISFRLRSRRSRNQLDLTTEVELEVLPELGLDPAGEG